MAKVLELLKRKSTRLVLAALLTYGASVAATGNYDPTPLVKAIVSAFEPETTPLQVLPPGSDAGP